MNSQDIVLSGEGQVGLSRRVRSATISQRDGRLTRVIFLATQAYSRNEIAELSGFSIVSVTRWCKCFQALRLQGLVGLSSGRARKPSLPAEALKRTLEQVTRPSIKLHLSRTFKLSNDPHFEEELWTIIGLCLAPPDKTLLLCCDEKSQDQALHRTQSDLALGIGHIRTQIHNYVRHGPLTLSAAMDYLQGRLISSIETQHRHREWLVFLKKINRETPKTLQLHLIVDNYAPTSILSSRNGSSSIRDFTCTSPRTDLPLPMEHKR